MTRDNRYNFYLDEVINIHNNVKEDSLRRKGVNPRFLMPEEIYSKD